MIHMIAYIAQFIELQAFCCSNTTRESTQAEENYTQLTTKAVTSFDSELFNFWGIICFCNAGDLHNECVN
jgi:hypothetical protein